MTVFAAIFVPEPLIEAVSDGAWLEAMLEVERALAAAEAATGVIPADAASGIAGACRAGELDVAELARAGRAVGNPAEPLVRALRARVGGDAARWVHHGATSQDVMDTASMLVTRNARELILAELDARRGCVRAARGRAPFDADGGADADAAGGADDVRPEGRGLARRRGRRACATRRGSAEGAARRRGRNACGARRPRAGRAARVRCRGSVSPSRCCRGTRAAFAWRSSATHSAAVAAACDKIALDVVLLGQTEIGEVSEAAGGGSSTMPQKRNTTRAAIARACARGVHAAAGVLTAGEYEHERAAGAWHAEWGALSDALALGGGAAAAIRECLEGLDVHADRMRANMSIGLVAERVAFALAEKLGREEAHAVVGEAFAGGDPRAALASHFDSAELDELLDATTYLGSADAFIERALALYRDGA